MPRRLLVFGYFGYATNQIDGQTIKTREVYEMLKGREETEARYADTQQFRKDFKSCIRFVRDFFWCKKPSLLGRLKENAYQESFLYTPRKAWDIIKRYV